MKRDPVCGMSVDESLAAGKREYQGTTYYFCAQGCARVFDEEPQKFIPRDGRQNANDLPSHADGDE